MTGPLQGTREYLSTTREPDVADQPGGKWDREGNQVNSTHEERVKNNKNGKREEKKEEKDSLRQTRR